MENFGKWWHKNMPYFECSDEEDCRIWKAAVAAEREACAPPPPNYKRETRHEQGRSNNEARWRSVRVDCRVGRLGTAANVAGVVFRLAAR